MEVLIKFKLFQIFFFVLMIGLLSSCENIIKVTKLADTSSSNLDFAGLSAVSDKTDTTLTLSWPTHKKAVAYEIFNTASGSPVSLKKVNGQASSSFKLTALEPNSNYKFRVRMINSSGASDGNTNDISITTNITPTSPSSLTVVTPSYSPSVIATPTLRINGVKNGDVIKLFTDISCTTQVATGTADGASIDLKTSVLTSAKNTFYATATNSHGSSSACSSASVSYGIKVCPSGYIGVPFNTGVETTADFCVAKYEMKKVQIQGRDVATATSAGTPWGSITHAGAIAACSDLNTVNSVSNKYFLISNPEWMTIARNIENVNANWSSGTAGSGVLNRGWTNVNTRAASETNSGCLYNNSSDACSSAGLHEYKRSHTLSTGDEIWDFSGNVYEWTDWIVSTEKEARATGANSTWQDFRYLDTNIGVNEEMRPSTWQSSFLTATRVEGIGGYFPGAASAAPAIRSGSWEDDDQAGVFSLVLFLPATTSADRIGFRCVYRP